MSAHWYGRSGLWPRRVYHAVPVPVQVTAPAGVSQVSVGIRDVLAIGSSTFAFVPDLSGDTTTQAGQALQTAGLVLGTVRSVVDNLIQVRGGSPVASRSVPARHLWFWRLPQAWLSGRDTDGDQPWVPGPTPPSK
jgi:hypothetical protein